MKLLYFTKKSEMTAFAKQSKKEMIRCKQPCNHVPGAFRQAILLVKNGNIITHRLIRCKVCSLKEGGHANGR